ncbi:potassium channel family protein [Lewinella sp. IMCC34183]|uniref:potassium channel family protein n=1 Tax=Lewinella sp. IMCC34183 TaxID=2248762 RepID=UPI000E26EA6E|nr:TrkA family potassium uptake protein [Lewinella sp. IMCC34183]
MKYLIVGLGSFGASLSQKLTARGHEVIGIDTSMEKVDQYKEKISHTICMDATNEFAVAGLPLRDADVVIVAIGEQRGANIMATALFKNLRVKRLISRAISPIHEKVLEAIGVDEIVHPEEEAAGRWDKKLSLNNVVDSFELGADHSIIEAGVPAEYIGKTIEEVGFRKKYNLLVLSTIKQTDEAGLIGKVRKHTVVRGVVLPDQVLEAGELVVLYGANEDLQHFLKRRS